MKNVPGYGFGLLVAVFSVLVIYPLHTEGKGSIRDCIKASSRLGNAGNGTTRTSCFYCDPTRPTCSSGCQGKIKDLYYDCDGVCLPDGYYYDDNAGKLLTGCWGTVKPEIKIKVERCGCDSAAAISLLAPFASILIATVVNMYR